MRIWSVRFAIGALSLAVVPVPVLAVEAGHTVSCAIGGGSAFVCQPAGAATVGAGIEYLIGFDPVARPDDPAPYLSADFSDGLLTIGSIRNNNLGLTILEFRNLTTPLLSWEWLGSSGFAPWQPGDAPVGPGRVSLVDGLVAVDLRGTTNSQGGVIRIGLASAPTDPGAIPEPASWAMLIAGFGLVGGALRLRRPAQA